ncbi:MAG: FadD3 family acyl-CoA ligase [Acidobacteria bacterium]|nr:FadD3 family acyl-CoA ligase [Acidobacteriota bacterium]
MRADQQWGTIGGLVMASAERFPDVEALVDGDLRLTFPQLRDAVVDAARAHIAAGVGPGDRVAIWAPNIAEWVIAGLGAVTAGAVLVPLNTRYKGTEAADIIRRSGASVLLCVNGFLGNDYVGMLEGQQLSCRIVVLRGDSPTGTIAWSDYLAAGAEVTTDAVAERQAATAPDDLCDLVFTSGTTGAPKGVMVTHAQTLRVFEVWADIVGLVEADRYLVVNPFFHTFGYKAGIIACLLKGATIIPEPVFDVGRVLTRIAAERVSMLPGPPTLFLSILNDPARDTFDLSSLRVAVTGAAAIPVSMIERMRDELTFRTIITAYGLTEATGTVTMCRAEDDPATIALTSGRAIPDTEVRIVDEDNNEVPRGEAGEIVCRGYNVMLGYLDNPTATAETVDPEGWLHTGDVGIMDERGYVRITDRTKDMFIVGGFNAYPAEIENLLMGFEGIAQVAVVGVPDERMGEVGMAFVVPREGVSIDPDALVAWARDTMANFKVPRHVRIVDALPTNASGKVVKVELRERGRAEIAGA